MADHAFEPSLSASDQAQPGTLERRQDNTDTAVYHLHQELQEWKAVAAANREQLERLAARVEAASTAEEIMRRAAAAGDSGSFPVPAYARPRRGLRVVRGGLAALIPLLLILGAVAVAQAGARPPHPHHFAVAHRRVRKDGGPSLTSSVRNPGPRFDAGSTVIV